MLIVATLLQSYMLIVATLLQSYMLSSVSSVLFRNRWDLSSALTALGSLQPRTLGFLNYLDPSDSASNHYMVQTFIKHSKLIDGKDTTKL